MPSKSTSKRCRSCGRVLPHSAFDRLTSAPPKGRKLPPLSHYCRECVGPHRAALAAIQPPNPSGLCQCGCGQPAPIATHTSLEEGHLRGHAKRFINNHHLRLLVRPIPEYVEDPETGCWNWQHAIYPAGYGAAKVGRSSRMAHREIYERLRGPVPDDMVLDHLCRNKRCVNPDHLEVVTIAENTRRGNAALLTEADVIEIRRSTLSNKELAAIYGVARATVANARAFRSWKKVKER